MHATVFTKVNFSRELDQFRIILEALILEWGDCHDTGG